jgi:hypothetical protein
MLGNLKAPPEPFADIILTHFRLKGRSISSQLDEWLRKDDGKPTTTDGGGYSNIKPDGPGNTNGFAKDVEDLKKFLKKLED